MIRAFAVALCAALLVGAEPEPSPSPVPSEAAETAATPAPSATSLRLLTDPYAILSRARDAFHAHLRPPYVVYNMDRRVWVDDQPDGQDSYTWRIWYRAADSSALQRIWYRFRKRAVAELHFIHPSFRLDGDPGPPTGDIFELPPPASPAPRPTGTERLRTIAVVSKAGDLDYRATLVAIDKGAYHLKLQPLRDEGRNRLRELWVGPDFEVIHAIEANRPHFDIEGLVGFVRLDMRFEMFQSVPVLRRAEELATILPTFGTTGHRVEFDFVYDEIVFATSLPGWYFDPKTYHARFRESPSY